jgi:hypothetical protein
MAIEAGDTIRCTARMTWNNVVSIQNTFWCYKTVSTNDDNEDNMADLATWIDGIYDNIVGAMPTNLTFDDIDFFNVTADQPLGSLPWPTQTTGNGGSTEIAATGVAAVITAFTAITKVRGRKFLGPLTEAAIDAGYLNTSTMLTLADIILDWMTPFVGTTTGNAWLPGVWRRLQEAFAPFTRAVVRNIPGYQRRRKAGVGS